MSIICLVRGMSLIGVNTIGLLSLVCLLMGIIASFQRYTGYLNFIKDPINHVLLLIPVHALLLILPHCD